MLLNSILGASLILMLHITIVSGQFKSIIGTIQDKGERAISAVATPVEKAIVAKTLKNCDAFKMLLGVSYNQLSDLTEDNIGKLNLELLAGVEKSIYNISVAGSGLLTDRNFDMSKPTAVFIHGFMSSSGTAAALEVTNALAARGGINVLALDASSIIKYLYLKSSTCVRFIGQYLGRAIANLVVEGGVNPKNIHLIGHSLGAHIAGFAGKTFMEVTGVKVGRISGLDPAGPCFFQKEPELRLQASDAEFVDVIHTDKGVLGIVDPIGDVDFYPNDGDAQPGCVIPPCSHSRAWQLYSESIMNPEAFPAVQCAGWASFQDGECTNSDQVPMGYGVKPTVRGTFYLRTGGDAPYALGSEGVAKKTCIKKRLLGWFKNQEDADELNTKQ